MPISCEHGVEVDCMKCILFEKPMGAMGGLTGADLDRKLRRDRALSYLAIAMMVGIVMTIVTSIHPPQKLPPGFWLEQDSFGKYRYCYTRGCSGSTPFKKWAIEGANKFAKPFVNKWQRVEE